MIWKELEEAWFKTHLSLQFAQTIQTEMFENCAPEIIVAQERGVLFCFYQCHICIIIITLR